MTFFKESISVENVFVLMKLKKQKLKPAITLVWQEALSLAHYVYLSWNNALCCDDHSNFELKVVVAHLIERFHIILFCIPPQ